MSRARLTLVLVGVVLAVCTAAPLIRFAEAPALSTAAWRIGLAALVYTALAGESGLAALAGLGAGDLLRLLVPGLLLALHFAVWIASLGLTSIASSVALVATQPLFAAGLSALLLRERPPRGTLAGVLIAGAGCALLAFGEAPAAAGGPARPFGAVLAGNALALLGAAAAAGYLVAGRGLRRRLPLGAYLALVHAVAAALLWAAALFTGTRLLGLPGRAYACFVALALVPTAIGHTLLNLAVRHAPATLCTLAILGEPVGATLIGWPLLGERPGLWVIAGGGLVILGVGYALVAGARQPGAPPAGALSATAGPPPPP